MKTRELSVVCLMILCGAYALADVPPPLSITSNSQASSRSASAVQWARAGRVVAYAETGQTEQGATWGAANALRDGSRAAGSDCAGDPNNPVPYLCGQNLDTTNTYPWQLSDYTFVGVGTGRVMCESYPPPGETINKDIGIVSWYGCYLKNSDSGGCVKPHLFRIVFYPDAGNKPNVTSPYKTYDNVVPVRAEVVGTLNFGGPTTTDMYAFTAVLATPCAQRSGWFSIASIQVASDCFHFIGPSNQGNISSWRYWTDNPTGGAAQANDLAYCFAENKQGACCDDCDPANCIDASNEFVCNQLGWRFEENKVCATMTPPCGDFVGQCCFNDGTAAPMTCIACLDPNRPGYDPEDEWVPSTDPNDCCVVTCPPGAVQEGEPPCSYGYIDHYNGGCNSEPPVFQPITCPATINGESGTFVLGCAGDTNCDGVVNFADINAFVDAIVKGIYCDGDGFNADVSQDDPIHVGFEDINPFVDLLTKNPLPIYCPGTKAPQYLAHDTDWYVYSSNQPFAYTWTVEAEFDPYIWIGVPGPDANEPCAGYWIVNDATGDRCALVSITTRCLKAGTYWFGVTTDDFTGVDCGRDYTATLAQEPCEPCDYVCDPNVPDPNVPGLMNEGEPCGVAYSSNGGCADPNDPNDVDEFTDLVFVEFPASTRHYYAAVCAQSYAGEEDPNQPGYTFRDIDWYHYYLNTTADVTFDVDTEIPLIMTPLFDAAGNPWYCGAPLYGYWGRHQVPCDELPALSVPIESGDNYIFVAPEYADGNPLFAGYPCASGDNTYILYVSYSDPNCPDILACIDTPEIAENEPACYDGYVDAYNGGCDVASPNPMIVLPGLECEWYICGSTAAYHQTADPNSPFVYDADWYTFALSVDKYLCIEAVAELPIEVDIYGPNPTCATLDTLHVFDGFYAACADYDQDPIDPDPNTTQREQCAAGNYWMRICLREGFTDVTCGLNWEYYVTMTCDENCPDTK